jgi:hypothetical protein
MKVRLKLNSHSFLLIKSGIKNYIEHGFSKNQKYLRLFKLKLNDEVELRNEITSEILKRKFKNIIIEEIENKKYFKMSFI